MSQPLLIGAPVAWLADLITAFAPADGLVLEMYGGMCPTARAARRSGRPSVSVEIDAERAADALALLAQDR